MGENLLEKLEELKEIKKEIYEEIHKVIIGQDNVIEKLLISLFTGGHCLLIGVPGLAKTLMIKTLAEILDLTFKRIQFTPDLMPSDITGTEIIQEDRITKERIIKFIQGPIFANIVLADEINRAPPKTQAALLESMQEYQVTVGGKIHLLEMPFIVFATQNPIELEGTYPLPEAQLDRFMLSIKIDYPEENEEKKIAEITTMGITPKLKKILSRERIIEFQNLIKKIPISDFIIDYVVKLVRSTRPGINHNSKFIQDYVSWGAGPRGVQFIVIASKAVTALRGDVNISISDIKKVVKDVLRHRIFLNFNADADGIDTEYIIDKLLEEVKV
ncbi:MAG TPA: MoxR family ATPase [bacterium]|nr:MoxR family ATPase [bacterium]HOM27171.1 MoxR family ATPase [bacterium]